MFAFNLHSLSLSPHRLLFLILGKLLLWRMCLLNTLWWRGASSFFLFFPDCCLFVYCCNYQCLSLFGWNCLVFFNFMFYIPLVSTRIWCSPQSDPPSPNYGKCNYAICWGWMLVHTFLWIPDYYCRRCQMGHPMALQT